MAFPTSAAPDLDPYQISYGGLVFGGLGGINNYQFQSLTGLDMQTMQSGDQQRPRDQGELIGLDVLGGRDVAFTVAAVQSRFSPSLEQLLDSLAAVMVPQGQTERPLWFARGDGVVKGVMARPRKMQYPYEVGYVAGRKAVTAVMFHATDPRVYASPQTVTTGLATGTVGGLTWPLTFPLTFGAGGLAGGTLIVTNAGNFETRPIITFTGPCTAPSITNNTIDGAPTLTFSNPLGSGLDLNAGDQLIVDLDLHTVTLVPVDSAPQPNFRSWVKAGSVWWTLLPGDNDISFQTADSGLVAATATVDFASAYLL